MSHKIPRQYENILDNYLYDFSNYLCPTLYKNEILPNVITTLSLLFTIVSLILFYDNKNILELLYYQSHPEKPFNNRARRISEIGCSHFALTVPDLDSLYNKLIEKGISFNYPVQTSPDRKVKIAFCRDPDGTLIELVEEL